LQGVRGYDIEVYILLVHPGDWRIFMIELARVPSDQGMTTQELSFQSNGHTVPGVIWKPIKLNSPRPLLLMGHGGSHHKTAPIMVDIARRFVCNHGFIVACIDGPIHGARRSELITGPQKQQEFLQMWEKDNCIDLMVSDWSFFLNELVKLEFINTQALGWYGISMGTAYGLPFIAADDRIKVALLGMWGGDFVNSQRLVDDAAKVKCQVFFQQKWDDQFFSREGQIQLFEKLGSVEKWLKVYPGAHVSVSGEQLDDIEDFLSKKLINLETKQSAINLNKIAEV